MVFVLHRPVPPHGGGELRDAFLFPPETGDEVAGLAFELFAVAFEPFAGASDELARAGKGADVLVEIAPGEVAALDAPVAFFPVAGPVVGDFPEAPFGQRVEGGLVVFKP
jgi:hypothetical protein